MPGLRIGAVDDAREHEADRAADQVVSGNPVRLSGYAAGSRAGALAPPGIRRGFESPGEALDPGSRAFFESRLGHDFAQVRVHSDDRAAESARAVGARAFTVGHEIVFGPGEYDPGRVQGRQLLAHELAHVVQQQQLGFPLVQRAVCKSGAACKGTIHGDIGPFREKVQEEEEAARKASGPPAAAGGSTVCSAPRHKDKATKVTDLAKAEGATLPSEVDGIYINGCLPTSAAAAENLCEFFPDGAPPGSDPAKSCIQVHASDDDFAKDMLGKSSRSDTESAKVSDLVASVIHESEHAHFDKSAVITAQPDCDRNTAIFHGATSGHDYTVEEYLSEMSAEIAEFTPFFEANKSAKSEASAKVMFKEERNVAKDGGENIGGIIRAMQCKCSCDTVNAFTEKVFNDATSSWPADQSKEFKRAMTAIIPGQWPKSLKP